MQEIKEVDFQEEPDVQALAPLAPHEQARPIVPQDLVQIAAELPAITADEITELTEKILPAAFRLVHPKTLVRYGDRVTVQATAARELAKFVGFIPRFKVAPHRIPPQGTPGSSYAYECEMEAVSIRYRTFCPGVRGHASSIEPYTQGRRGTDVTPAKIEDSVRNSCISRAYRRAFVSCCGMDAIRPDLLTAGKISLADIPEVKFADKPQSAEQMGALPEGEEIAEIAAIAKELGGEGRELAFTAYRAKDGALRQQRSWDKILEWQLTIALNRARLAKSSHQEQPFTTWAEVTTWIEEQLPSAGTK